MVHSHFLTFLLLFDGTDFGGGVPFRVLGPALSSVSLATLDTHLMSDSLSSDTS